jgi:hypothetical protein
VKNGEILFASRNDRHSLRSYLVMWVSRVGAYRSRTGHIHSLPRSQEINLTDISSAVILPRRRCSRAVSIWISWHSLIDIRIPRISSVRYGHISHRWVSEMLHRWRRCSLSSEPEPINPISVFSSQLQPLSLVRLHESKSILLHRRESSHLPSIHQLDP